MYTKAAQASNSAAVNPATMANAIISSAGGAIGGADKHVCSVHDPGVVIDGSRMVLINGLPACRMGDTILEPIDPPNKIARGCLNVLIGN